MEQNSCNTLTRSIVSFRHHLGMFNCTQCSRHLSWSISNAKSHSLTSTLPLLGLLHWPHLGPHRLHRLVLITSDQVLWSSSHHIQSHSQNPGHAHLWPRGCGGLPRSHGHHMTITQLHTTSSADPLAGGPGTWGSQPSLFSIYFYLIVCQCSSDCSAVLICIPVLIPDLEADCMHHCALFTSPSLPPPCRQPP